MIIKGKGFTLIEILIYIAVLAVIISAVISFFLWSVSSQRKEKAAREVLNSATRAMELITFETRAAKSIYTPNTTSTQLSLETRRYLSPQEFTSFLDFFLCKKQICFKREFQNPISITSNFVEIDKIEFIPVLKGSMESVSVVIEASYKNPSNKPELEASVRLSSVVALRSY